MGCPRLYSDEERKIRRKIAANKYARKAYALDPKKAYTAVKKWRTKNKDKINALNRNRVRIKKLATPSWADLVKIKEFYKNCPKDMVVDHILPLQGVEVTGLHILENLQYLTKSENIRKRNYVKAG